jgi:hypothetical protein
MQTETFGVAGHVEVENPRLDPRHSRGDVDGEDPIHFAQAHDDRTVDRRGPTSETRSRSTSDERSAMSGALSDDVSNLFGRRRIAHDSRSTDQIRCVVVEEMKFVAFHANVVDDATQ